MDDSELVVALKRRDPAAIAALIETHGQRLLRSATLLCGNEHTAQDLVQDTLVAAWRSGDRFRGHSGLYTWLHSILLNLTRHHHRAGQRLIYDNELALRVRGLAESILVRIPGYCATSNGAIAIRQRLQGSQTNRSRPGQIRLCMRISVIPCPRRRIWTPPIPRMA